MRRYEGHESKAQYKVWILRRMRRTVSPRSTTRKMTRWMTRMRKMTEKVPETCP